MPRHDQPQYLAAFHIARRLRERGYAAYFAGGCVRDLLLGVVPKDFDVATSAPPDIVQRLFPRTEAVGASFGVILVIDRVVGGVRDERIATEVATFRHDGAYTDGRRPDAVRFSTDPREDVLRRDFTVNGLLLDALAYDAGDPLEDCILDFVEGRRDLHDKVLRAIGEPDRRFAEDKLRMLRAVRFAARLGFQIEPRTLRAMQAQAAEIAQVSAERVRDELTKILTEGHAPRGFALLDETGLLAEVLPEIERMKGVQQPPQYHPEGDVWVHTLMLLAHLGANSEPSNPGFPVHRALLRDERASEGIVGEIAPAHRQERDERGTPRASEGVAGEIAPAHRQERDERGTPFGTPNVSPTLAWGMLLHDVGKPPTYTPPDPAKPGDRIRFNGHVEVGVAMARDILARLRFSNDDTEQIVALIQHHMQFGDIGKMKQSTLKRFLRLPRFDEHLALHYADVMSSHGRRELYDFAKKQYEESPPEQVRPVLLVTGQHLIAAGYKPGPAFKAMLTAAEDAQLEGRVGSTEEAMAFLRDTFGDAPARPEAASETT